MNIKSILNDICTQLTQQKKKYFSVKGKAGWEPLKESTLERKRRAGSSTVNSFNTRTGTLKEGIDVTWMPTKRGVRITTNTHNGSDEKQINNIAKTLGRDFMKFDNKEKTFIVEQLVKRLKNASKG